MERPHYKKLYEQARFEIEVLVKANVALRQELEKGFFRQIWERILGIFR